jgi:hypothetical protein
MTVIEFVAAYIGLIVAVLIVILIVGAARTPKDWR